MAKSPLFGAFHVIKFFKSGVSRNGVLCKIVSQDLENDLNKLYLLSFFYEGDYCKYLLMTIHEKKNKSAGMVFSELELKKVRCETINERMATLMIIYLIGAGGGGDEVGREITNSTIVGHGQFAYLFAIFQDGKFQRFHSGTSFRWFMVKELNEIIKLLRLRICSCGKKKSKLKKYSTGKT